MCTNRHRIINNQRYSKALKKQALFFVPVLEHSQNNHSVDATCHFLGDRRVRPITIVCIKSYNLNLLLSALILPCLHYKAQTACWDTRQDRDSNPQDQDKAKTMTPKTKAKAPKNCLEAVSRQDSALRLSRGKTVPRGLTSLVLIMWKIRRRFISPIFLCFQNKSRVL